MNAEEKKCCTLWCFKSAHDSFNSNKSTKAYLRVKIHCEYSFLEVNESAVEPTVLGMHSLDLMADGCVTKQAQDDRGRASFALTQAVPSMLLDSGSQVFRRLLSKTPF